MSLTLSIILAAKSSKSNETPTPSNTPTIQEKILPSTIKNHEKQKVKDFLTKWVVVVVLLIVIDILLIIASFYSLFHSNLNHYIVFVLFILMFVPRVGTVIQICIIIYHIIYITKLKAKPKAP